MGLGILAHFGTLEWDALSIGSIVFAAALHCANLGLLFVAWSSDTWQATLIRIGMFISCPAIVVICYVGYQFVDNHYTFTKMMGLRLSVVAVPIVFGIVSVGVYSASAAAALSVLVIFLLYLCFLTYSYVSNRFHLSMLQRRVAFAVFGFVMLTGFVFAIGAYASNEHQLSFAAGTIAWSVPAIVLALYVEPSITHIKLFSHTQLFTGSHSEHGTIVQTHPCIARTLCIPYFILVKTIKSRTRRMLQVRHICVS